MNNGMLNTLSSTTSTYVGSVVYDAAGRVTSRRVGTLSLYTTFSYYGWDEGYPAGRLETIQTGARQNLTYTYNNDGNITTITDAVNSNQVQTFGYDDLHRLTSAVTSAAGYGQYTNQTYAYDADTGNLEMKGSLSLDYEQNQQPTAPYHGVKSSSNGNTYGYDANGNMVTRIIGTTTYTLVFDVANRLVEVKTNGVTSAQLVYDGDGNRVKTVISGVTTYFIGSYFEKSGSTIKKYYYYGSTRVAMRSGSTLYFLLADHLGSTTMFLNSSGSRVTELMYKPWGENRYTYGLVPSTFQYTGQRNEPSIAGGLMYYGARYFDSSIGRFISADTVVPGAGNPQAWDRYAYVFNNPLSYTDPTGHNICHGPAGAQVCADAGNGLTVNPPTNPPETQDEPDIDIPLTDWGKKIGVMYIKWLNMDGWWQDWIANGTDPLTLLFSIILARESYTLWVFGNWGNGGVYDGSDWFKQAANHNLWGFLQDTAHANFGNLSKENQIKAIFNAIGAMESARDRYDVFESSIVEFVKTMDRSNYNPQLLSVTDYAMKNPTTGYWTWGNDLPIPAGRVFFYPENFFIYPDYYKP